MCKIPNIFNKFTAIQGDKECNKINKTKNNLKGNRRSVQIILLSSWFLENISSKCKTCGAKINVTCCFDCDVSEDKNQ